jgi:protein-disulfide isomerase
MIMKYLPALLIALALPLACSAQTSAQDRDRSMQAVSEFPLTGDDGARLANHTVKVPGPIDRLPGVVVAANPGGTTTLIEFYDLNCPYCRVASADIADMVDLDPQLRLVLVPFPVLGIASIGASRVELAVAKLGSPAQFYDFHRKIYAKRGVTDGERALEVAHGLGFDKQVLTTVGR